MNIENNSAQNLKDLSFIHDIESGDVSEIPKKFQQLVIHIHGDQLDGSIDAQVASAMVQLQQQIYRLATKVIYGETATTNSLKEEELESFKLQFIVSKGSTNIAVDVLDKAEKLVRTFTTDMTPTQNYVCQA